MRNAISKLSIRGFKSIRVLEDFEIGEVTILIGANGAGKSNFVGFFSLLRDIVQQELQLTIARHGGADAHLYLGPKVTSSIEGRFFFGLNGYEFALVPTTKNELVFDKEAAYFEGVHYGETRTPFGSGHAESRLRDHKDDKLSSGSPAIASYVYSAMSSWTVYHFHDTTETASVRRKGTIRDYDELRPDAGNLAAYLCHLRTEAPQNYERIRDAIRLVAPFFDDFKLRPEKNAKDTLIQLEWTQRGTDYPFHPSQLSDGTLRFACLATALLQPNPPAIILFDEPELGLHPFALHVLGDLFHDARTRTQVIVSTQSAALLDRFDVDSIVVINRKDAESVFERLSRKKLKEWLDEYSLSELWEKNVFGGRPE